MRCVAARRLAVTIVLALGLVPGDVVAAESYTPAELRVLRSLWIGSLPPLPDDPSNAYDTDPRAAKLGRALFFDQRFSKSGTLACVTCHPAETSFQDRKPVAVGVAPLTRRSMPLLGVAYNTWFFWDGRKDSLWAQAATPIENPLELGLSRADVVAYVAKRHRSECRGHLRSAPVERGDTRTPVLANVGKAIAAFVRTITPGPARSIGTSRRCSRQAPPRDGAAHAAERAVSGSSSVAPSAPTATPGRSSRTASFTSRGFPRPDPTSGRSAAIALVQGDELNCLGAYSDATPTSAPPSALVDPDTRDTLRAQDPDAPERRRPRADMNAGQLASPAEVLRFYRDRTHGMKEMAHGDLSDAELADLEAFLGTLTGPVTALGESVPSRPSGS
jgi:cytochrome c peroxidase